LQSQINSSNSQRTSLQSQVTNYQNIANLSLNNSIIGSQTISQNAGEVTSVASFTATYAGYLTISGTCTSATGYIRVTDSYGSYPYDSYNYAFGGGTTLVIPVLPGTAVIYFGNTDASGTLSATLSATLYY
jgi:hypothetical protein